MNLFPMTKEQYGDYLKSFKWRQLRAKVFKRDGYKCVECRSKWNLQCHHLTYERIGEERLEDLETRCRKCHEKRHKGELLIKVIEICCKRFLSQRPGEDYNPKIPPKCFTCGSEQIEYTYGITVRGNMPLYCAPCALGIKRLLLKSKAPQLALEVMLLEDLRHLEKTIRDLDDE